MGELTRCNKQKRVNRGSSVHVNVSPGVLVIDKPSGMTSHDVVSVIRKSAVNKKVGHLGTLDPIATGVLPVCIGRATKMAMFLNGGVKEYVATIMLGVETDSYDADGKITETKDPPLIDAKGLMEVLKPFRGRMMQVPPLFSAIKFHGTPLYKLARKGIPVKVKPREIEIYSIALEHIDLPCFTIRIRCSKGTYIRSLAHDIGSQLKCGAHITAIRRTRSGHFTLDDAVTLDQCGESITRNLIPLDKIINGDYLDAERDNIALARLLRVWRRSC